MIQEDLDYQTDTFKAGLNSSNVSLDDYEDFDEVILDKSEDRPDETSGDLGGNAYSKKLGCLSSFAFFARHSFRDVRRRKGHFCLAFCSVFIAVLATLVVNTVISKGPIIFLTLSQADTGEIDGWYSNFNDTSDF